jgi:hypothetical protein
MLILSVNGPMAVNADIGNHILVPAARTLTPTACRGEVKTAPSGSSLVVVLNVNGSTYITLTWTAGNTLTSATPSGTIPTSAIISLAVTAIGSVDAGSDLSITLSW